MNILSRLKKLEKAGDDSTVCACYPQHFSVFVQDLGADAETKDRFPDEWKANNK